MFSILLLSLLCAISAADASGACDDGWSFYKEGNKCIKVFLESKQWRDAKSECEKEGGRLLSIPDASTQAFINNNLDKVSLSELWIGLSDRSEENTFKWTDGTSIACGYQNWAKGEPNNIRNEDCVHIHMGGQHFWNDEICSLHLPFVCEKRGPGCDYLNGGCVAQCRDAADGSWGVECTCGTGYALYEGKCYDIDECSVDNGGCDSICENVPGTYACSCDMDYVYNGTHCVVNDDGLIIG